jgi:hypothetical protein
MLTVGLLAVSLAPLAAGCATSDGGGVQPTPSGRRSAALRARAVKVAFVGNEVWFVAPDRRWRLDGVTKGDVVWAPDGRQLAYTKPPAGRTTRWRVVVRNDAGEPVNEFYVYSDGRPEGLEFRGDRRLAYEIPVTAAPTASGKDGAQPARVLVEHDVRSGEIAAVHRGKSFVWSPDRRLLAYVGSAAAGDRVRVDSARVYPRSETVKVSVVSPIAWAPGGRGLAFLITRTEPRRGRKKPTGPAKVVLVVILEPDDAAGDLTWDVPPGKDPGEALNVFWAGKSRVVVGPAQFKPRFSASWQRER